MRENFRYLILKQKSCLNATGFIGGFLRSFCDKKTVSPKNGKICPKIETNFDDFVKKKLKKGEFWCVLFWHGICYNYWCRKSNLEFFYFRVI